MGRWADAEFILWALDRRVPSTAAAIRARFGCSAATSYRWQAWVPWIRGEQAGRVVLTNPGRARRLTELRDQLLWARAQPQPITCCLVRAEYGFSRCRAWRLAQVLEDARSLYQVKQGLQHRRAPSQPRVRH